MCRCRAIRAVCATALLWTVGLAGAQQSPPDAPAAATPEPAPAAAPAPAPDAAPALVIVDAANTLRSYDAGGKSLQEMPVDRQRAVLNGGSLFAMDTVYLTYERRAGGGPGPAIAAFNARTLAPLMLRKGAFKAADGEDPGGYTGIAFDPAAGEFYVATERLGVLVFDRTGRYLPRMPEATVEVTGISIDPGQLGLWGVQGHRSVVRFRRAESAPASTLELKSFPKKRGQEPLAVAVCRSGADGVPPAALVVLFSDFRHGASQGAARAFGSNGVPIGPAFEGRIVNPHGIACTTHGDVFIAADNGLLAYGLDGRRRAPPGALATLDEPILGVAAAP